MPLGSRRWTAECSEIVTESWAQGHFSWKKQTRTEAPFMKGQVTPPNYLPHLLRINKGRMQEIECLKIQTHYRKSCSEKRPQRKFFKVKHRKLLSRSPKPGCALEGAQSILTTLGSSRTLHSALLQHPTQRGKELWPELCTQRLNSRKVLLEKKIQNLPWN